MIKLNRISRSLSVEICKFLSRFHFSFEERDGSKQAFSKALKGIKWEGFVALLDHFVQNYYKDKQLLYFEDNYLLIASDGSFYQLPYEPALIDHYNECDIGKGQPVCMAQGVKLYDLLNKINICSTLLPFNAGKAKGKSEGEGFEMCLEKLPGLIDNKKHKILLVGDRHYPCFYYFHQLPVLGYDFVFRCKAHFCTEVKQFCESGHLDQWLNIDLRKSKRKYGSSASRLDRSIDQLSVRCVRIESKNKEQQDYFLLTNVSQQQLSRANIGQIYKLRWNEETSFDTEKNKLEIENISSKSVNGVQQDYYATLLTANIAQLLINEAQQVLEKQQRGKDNKHIYQINQAVAIGLIKDEIPKFILGIENPEKWYERMIKKIVRRREPIRKNRFYPKTKKHNLKFPMNKRPCI